MKPRMNEYEKRKSNGKQVLHMFLSRKVLDDLHRFVETKRDGYLKAPKCAVVEQAIAEFIEKHS